MCDASCRGGRPRRVRAHGPGRGGAGQPDRARCPRRAGGLAHVHLLAQHRRVPGHGRRRQPAGGVGQLGLLLDQSRGAGRGGPDDWPHSLGAALRGLQRAAAAVDHRAEPPLGRQSRARAPRPGARDAAGCRVASGPGRRGRLARVEGAARRRTLPGRRRGCTRVAGRPRRRRAGRSHGQAALGRRPARHARGPAGAMSRATAHPHERPPPDGPHRRRQALGVPGVGGEREAGESRRRRRQAAGGVVRSRPGLRGLGRDAEAARGPPQGGARPSLHPTRLRHVRGAPWPPRQGHHAPGEGASTRLREAAGRGDREEGEAASVRIAPRHRRCRLAGQGHSVRPDAPRRRRHPARAGSPPRARAAVAGCHRGLPGHHRALSARAVAHAGRPERQGQGDCER